MASGSFDQRSEYHSETELGKGQRRAESVEDYQCLPANIVSYDGNGRATVKIAHLKVHNNENVEYPEMMDVPVWTPKFGKFTIDDGVPEGCSGMMIFCQREIDTWKNRGDGEPLRIHRIKDISDGWFMPGNFRDDNLVNILDCMRDITDILEQVAGSLTPPRADLVTLIQVIATKLEASQ